MELAIGLISGTSMDGVDGALVGRRDDGGVEVLATLTTPYPAEVRAGLTTCQECADLALVTRLDVVVGEVFAVAANELLVRADIDPAAVRCVGSHGQTLLHLPEPFRLGGFDVRASLQIGNGAVIAARTGITTVNDFRSADLALGGQGAPLVPLLDWAIYRHDSRGRVLLNLGGIANVTGLPPAAPIESVVAFDTGPANVLLDRIARDRDLPDGIDRDGAVAAAGAIDDALLERLASLQYFDRPPPKSADIADFLVALSAASDLVEGLSTSDVLATLAELTARTVGDAVQRWLVPIQPVDEVLVAGGGLHNAAVMAALRRHLPDRDVRPLPIDQHIPADAKEAVAFALLGLRTLASQYGNVPSATGASRAAVLGAIYPPP